MAVTKENLEGSILFLDDELDQRTAMEFILNEEFPSIKVSLARNKSEAIDLLKSFPHDILVLDINLGEGDKMGGFDVLDYAKNQNYLFRSIAFTDYDKYAFSSGKAGFNVFIPKSGYETRLINTIIEQFQSLVNEREKTTIGTAFCIMPFDEDFLDIYIYGIKASCQAARFECFRIDEKTFTKDILAQVHKAIEEADIIIADLTGNNPNVYYEVGYAHAKEKTVVLIAQNSNDIVFDLRNYRAIVYHNKILELQNKLEKTLKDLLENSSK